MVPVHTKVQSITPTSQLILKDSTSSSNSISTGATSNSFRRHFTRTRDWQLKSTIDMATKISCTQIRALNLNWGLFNSFHSRAKTSKWVRLKSWTIVAKDCMSKLERTSNQSKRRTEAQIGRRGYKIAIDLREQLTRCHPMVLIPGVHTSPILSLRKLTRTGTI